MCFDIETINVNNIQIPILITFAFLTKSKTISSLEVLINKKMLNNIDLAVIDLWTRFFDTLNKVLIKHNKPVIFAHNLGSFDGLILFKGLVNICNPDKIQTIVDKDNKFIQIQVSYKEISLTFKDSLRIFNVSLDSLCQTFNVKGKSSKYKLKYNNINIFNKYWLLKSLIEYGKQDSIALLKALHEAQNIYIQKYNVDIATIWSSSTLSLKIFRQNFLDLPIPTLNESIDYFVRDGNFGGATDHYKMYGENLHHYDVNSLYPHVMRNPLPFLPLTFINDMSKINLNDFFGFCLAKIEAPKNIKIPLLPYKTETGEIIFPTGSWIDVYFSEELKAIIPYGYKITLIKGKSFTKKVLFNDYIQHFYQIKKKIYL